MATPQKRRENQITYERALEFQHRYDEITDTFVIVVKDGTYVLAPTGDLLITSEDKPHKNTMLYRCCFYDAVISDKKPIHIGTGREAWIILHAMRHHIKSGNCATGMIQKASY